MDAASLLFPDASFDTVAVSNSLHHLRDPRQVLAEMMRVLKPAGLFIVREMYRDRLTAAQKSHLLFHHLRSDIDTANGVFHRHTYQRRVLERMYRSLGLTGFRLFDLGAGDDDPRATEAPRHLIRMLDIWRRRPVDLPGIRLRIEAVEKHIRQHGFLPASSLVGIGRKPRTGKR